MALTRPHEFEATGFEVCYNGGMRVRHYTTVSLLLLLITPLGRPDQAESRSGSGARLSQQDITITIEPYFDEELVKKTFHKFLVEHRITPVKVTIRNDRAEPIRVLADTIRLIDPFDIRYRTLTAFEIVHDATRSGSAKRRRPSVHAPLPIPPPMPRRSASPSGKLRDLEMAIRSRELGARLVPPQSEEAGFLFFRIEGGPNTWKGSRLYVPDVRTLKTGDRLLFFEIDLKSAK